MKIKESTTTGLVTEILKNSPTEFMSVKMLALSSHKSICQVSAALHHLRAHNAVDVVVEKDGTGWWFLTPEYDNRNFTKEEYTPHTKPNRKSKKKLP